MASGSTAHLVLSEILKHFTCLREACQFCRSCNLSSTIRRQDWKAKLSLLFASLACLCIRPHAACRVLCSVIGHLQFWAWSCHRSYRLPSRSLNQLTIITYHVSLHKVGTCTVTPGCPPWQRWQKQTSAGSYRSWRSQGLGLSWPDIRRRPLIATNFTTIHTFVDTFLVRQQGIVEQVTASV